MTKSEAFLGIIASQVKKHLEQLAHFEQFEENTLEKKALLLKIYEIFHSNPFLEDIYYELLELFSDDLRLTPLIPQLDKCYFGSFN